MLHAKVWGTTEEIFDNGSVEIHRIYVKKGGYCSKHKHQYKYNNFYIESGSLEISIFRDNLIDSTTLSGAESTSIEPNVYHMFRAIEDTVAYEIYYTELKKDDIIRENVGGFIQ